VWVSEKNSVNLPKIRTFLPGDKFLDQGSVWDESSSGLMMEKVIAANMICPQQRISFCDSE
jgi:hypothetical protein